MNIRPVDLLLGTINAASHPVSMVSLFETMGSLCAETLSACFVKEWGESVRLDSEVQQIESGPQQHSESDTENFIIQPFTINEHLMAALYIDRRMPSMLVDIACGGNGDMPLAKQNLTVSEKHMLNRLVRFLTSHYAKAIEEVTGSSEISFIPVVNDVAGNRHPAQPELSHTLKFSVGVNTVDICFVISIDDFYQLQLKQPERSSFTPDARELKQVINAVPVQLTATLCEYTSSLRDIQRLQPGDFIPIRMSSMANIHSRGRHLFNAQVVKQNDRLCLQVMSPVKHSPVFETSESEIAG